jgi:aspartate/methionine/tyrosine aminotransferase
VESLAQEYLSTPRWWHSWCARALLEPNRALVNEFPAKHPELDCEPSRFGSTVFPRLKVGHAGAFVKMLREQFETSVVPGDFFEQPQHFRVGFCGTAETVRVGLDRLGAALDAFRRMYC